MHLTQAFAMLRPRTGHCARACYTNSYMDIDHDASLDLETLAIQTRLRDPVRVPSVLKRFNLVLGLRTTPRLAGITMLASACWSTFCPRLKVNRTLKQRIFALRLTDITPGRPCVSRSRLADHHFKYTTKAAAMRASTLYSKIMIRSHNIQIPLINATYLAAQ
jgi:hypothetical protein